MRYFVIFACFGLQLNCDSGSTHMSSCGFQECCEHVSSRDRPPGDAKNWACSNHQPQHLASAREIGDVSRENGCKGWKRIR